MEHYYDLILGFIPLALLGIAGALFHVGVSFELAVSFGGLMAVGLIAHAVFVNGPVAAPSESTPGQQSHVSNRTFDAD